MLVQKGQALVGGRRGGGRDQHAHLRPLVLQLAKLHLYAHGYPLRPPEGLLPPHSPQFRPRWEKASEAPSRKADSCTTRRPHCHITKGKARMGPQGTCRCDHPRGVVETP